MKNSLNVFKYDYLPLTYWKNWFINISQFFRNIKWAYQRATKGYCNRDTYDMDYWISELMYNSLKYFSEHAHGYPDFLEEINSYEDWQNVIREMAEHFLNTQEYNKDIPANQKASKALDDMLKYEESTEFVKVDDDNKFKDCYKLETTFIDEEAYKKAREIWLKEEENARNFRMSEKDKAFEMLSKYFFSLWD